MPAQDLALSSVAKTHSYEAGDEGNSWRVKWIFRRSSAKIGGFTYAVARDLSAEEATAWEQYSIRYAEQISAAWEAGDEERLENIIEEIEHAVSSEGQAETPEADAESADSDGDGSTARSSDTGTGG